MKKIDLAYMAGIIDGEGCIGISKITSPSCYTHYRVTLTIGSKDLSIIRWLQKNFSGYMYRHRYYANRKYSGYVVVWVSWDALRILKRTVRYMVIKRKRTEFLLRNWPAWKVKDGRKRDWIKRKIQDYNQRRI